MLVTSIFSFSHNVFQKASFSGLLKVGIVWGKVRGKSPKRQILNSSKINEFADNNSEFYENGVKFTERIENSGEKEKWLVTSTFSFSHRVFKRFVVLQTQKNKGLFGKGLRINRYKRSQKFS